MLKTLKLSKPLLVNGKELNELNYDYDLITPRDLLSMGNGQPMRIPAEIKLDFDDPYRCGQVFMRAVTHAMPEVAAEDLMRMSGIDFAAGQVTGQNFFAAGFTASLPSRAYAE